jgi:hypothetical protein
MMISHRAVCKTFSLDEVDLDFFSLLTMEVFFFANKIIFVDVDVYFGEICTGLFYQLQFLTDLFVFCTIYNIYIYLVVVIKK